MKKLISIFAIAFFFGIANITSTYASSTPVYDETYNNNQGAIYSNGTPVTISESNGNTVVSWDGGSQVVPTTVTIFGGGNGEKYDSSSITLNGGKVQNLVGGGIGYTIENGTEVDNTNIIINDGVVTNAVVGGGYFYSKTNTSNIELNGGTVLSLQGGSIATGKISGKNYSVGTKDDSINSQNRVNTANVVINNGTITSLLFGGGQGYSYTGTANLTINGGDMSKAYVTAGGSNGYTGNANVKINGGSIYLYQSVNRGTLENVDIKLAHGSVDKFYIGGETEDSTVTGKLNSVTANLICGNIGTLNSGTSAGSAITIDNNNYKVISTDSTKINTDNIAYAEIKVFYDFEVPTKDLILYQNKRHQVDLKIKTVPENYERVFEDVIIYESQNPEIATVSNDGTITGVSKGSTVISVTVGDKTDYINVEVKDSSFFIIVAVIIAFLALAFLLIFLFFIV